VLLYVAFSSPSRFYERISVTVRVQKGRFSAPKLMLPMCVFSKRLNWMKLGPEERSVRIGYMST